MNKKIFILILVCTIFLTACSSKKDETKVESNGEVINISSMKHKKCSRTGNAGSGIDVSLNYDLYYTGDILNILHSEEKVVATNESDLDTYEEAYKKIYKNYEGLKYYDAKVEGLDFAPILFIARRRLHESTVAENVRSPLPRGGWCRRSVLVCPCR